MSEWKQILPTPGSKEAREQGCTCPVMDNRYGEGVTGQDGSLQFWINEGCPLHGKEE